MQATPSIVDPNDATSSLPPLMAGWVNEMLGDRIPAETNATCSDCAMCRPPGRGLTAAATSFRPDVKCCSYMPKLPNFAVGAVLSDIAPESARGRVSVEQRIDAKLGVTPLGLEMPALYKALYEGGRVAAFGSSRRLLCPHFVDESGGRCGIWHHRNAVCSTYFCKFVRGKTGHEFWSRLNQVLGEAEAGLARWCVQELDLELDALAHLMRAGPPATTNGVELTSEALDGTADQAAYRRSWGRKWLGREHEFYVAAAALVEELDWGDIVDICGVRIRQYAQLTRDAYGRLIDESIPDYLAVGTISVTLLKNGFVAVRSYSAQDQLIVHRTILDALCVFDGSHTTPDALRELERRGVRIPVSYLRQMIDFAILVPAVRDAAEPEQPMTSPRGAS